MNKFFIFIIIISSVFGLEARPIDANEAQAIAAKFFNCPEYGIKKAKVVNQATDNPTCPYYIFDNPTSAGFVIVSGDTQVPAILGYSNRNNFDISNIPPQLKWLLDAYSNQIEAIPHYASSLQRANISEQDTEVILNTAEWGQGSPYNSKCPVTEGVNAQTGCIATAMAICMKEMAGNLQLGRNAFE